MRFLNALLVSGLLVTTTTVLAGDNLTLDSAIGGAVGGAIGGAVGAELGGRDGAIVGAGLGAAAGTAYNTRDHKENDYERRDRRHRYYDNRHAPSRGRFCPPGQAKKGNC